MAVNSCLIAGRTIRNTALLSSLYSHAFWLCRDDAEAEDLVQEILSKALRSFHSFKPGRN
jgi:RNA polymerase sigma-70 factor (ECF subfamily)